MKFSRAQTFVNQIWRRFVMILLVTQILVISSFFLLSASHVGKILGTNLTGLMRIMDNVYTHADPVFGIHPLDWCLGGLIIQRTLIYPIILP